MNTQNVSQDDWIIGGLALLLAIDLLVLPWFSLSVQIGGFSVGGDLTGTDAPDGWLGILAVVAAVGVVVDLALERLSPQTSVPVIGGSRATTRLVLAGAAAGFVALKFLFHIGHVGDLGFGFWLGAVIAAGLVFMAFRASQQPAIS
jgi:hypothetical protein